MDSRLHDQEIWISKCPLKRPPLERRIKHYFNLHQILLVGEGDFSFSLALASAFGSAENMVPTSLDSREKIISSYESGQNNLHNLEKRGAMILHGVDATTMNKLEVLKERRFDRIVYNFPHAGFFGKEHENKVIRKHRHLLNMFFKNGMTMLNKMGEIHVTHKVHDPYDKWKLMEQAEKCGLLLKESANFDIADYPGYTNRRGAGPRIGETFSLGECRTYMFILREFMTTPTMLPKISSQGHPKSLEATILELETERQNRKAAETAKANLESSLNHLRTVSDKTFKEMDGLRRQRDDAYSQKKKASRKKENITKQLAKALRLKENAIKQKNASILELELERKARKDAETAKANFEGSLNHYKASVYNLELKKMNQLVSSRDDALYQKEEACREKEKIAEQLNEALRLKEEATNEKERIAEALRLKEDALRQRDATILEFEFERKARKAAETAKANIAVSHNHYKASVYDSELKKMNQLGKQRDDTLYQKEVACKEKEKIAKQLNEALRLKEEATNEKERILREHNSYLANPREEITCWSIFASCCFRL